MKIRKLTVFVMAIISAFAISASVLVFNPLTANAVDPIVLTEDTEMDLSTMVAGEKTGFSGGGYKAVSYQSANDRLYFSYASNWEYFSFAFGKYDVSVIDEIKFEIRSVTMGLDVLFYAQDKLVMSSPKQRITLPNNVTTEISIDAQTYANSDGTLTDIVMAFAQAGGYKPSGSGEVIITKITYVLKTTVITEDTEIDLSTVVAREKVGFSNGSYKEVSYQPANERLYFSYANNYEYFAFAFGKYDVSVIDKIKFEIRSVTRELDVLFYAQDKLVMSSPKQRITLPNNVTTEISIDAQTYANSDGTLTDIVMAFAQAGGYRPSGSGEVVITKITYVLKTTVITEDTEIDLSTVVAREKVGFSSGAYKVVSYQPANDRLYFSYANNWEYFSFAFGKYDVSVIDKIKFEIRSVTRELDVLFYAQDKLVMSSPKQRITLPNNVTTEISIDAQTYANSDGTLTDIVMAFAQAGGYRPSGSGEVVITKITYVLKVEEPEIEDPLDPELTYFDLSKVTFASTNFDKGSYTAAKYNSENGRITVNYSNGYAYSRICFDSLVAKEYSEIILEFIAVDRDVNVMFYLQSNLVMGSPYQNFDLTMGETVKVVLNPRTYANADGTIDNIVFAFQNDGNKKPGAWGNAHIKRISVRPYEFKGDESVDFSSVTFKANESGFEGCNYYTSGHSKVDGELNFNYPNNYYYFCFYFDAYDASKVSELVLTVKALSRNVSIMFYTKESLVLSYPNKIVDLIADQETKITLPADKYKNSDGTIDHVVLAFADNGSAGGRKPNAWGNVRITEVTVNENDVITFADGTEAVVSPSEGVTLPSSSTENFIGWTTSEDGLSDLYLAGESVIFTEDVKLYPAKFFFETEEGASIRLSSPSGIRFTSNISLDYEEYFKDAESFEFGTIIMPYKFFNGSFDVSTYSADEYKKIVNTKWLNENSAQQDGYYTYGGALVGIKDKNYIQDYLGVGYLTVTFKGGKTVTIYGDSIENVSDHVRNIHYVAKRAYNNNETGEFIEEILNKVVVLDYSTGSLQVGTSSESNFTETYTCVKENGYYVVTATEEIARIIVSGKVLQESEYVLSNGNKTAKIEFDIVENAHLTEGVEMGAFYMPDPTSSVSYSDVKVLGMDYVQLYGASVGYTNSDRMRKAAEKCEQAGVDFFVAGAPSESENQTFIDVFNITYFNSYSHFRGFFIDEPTPLEVTQDIAPAMATFVSNFPNKTLFVNAFPYGGTEDINTEAKYTSYLNSIISLYQTSGYGGEKWVAFDRYPFKQGDNVSKQKYVYNMQLINKTVANSSVSNLKTAIYVQTGGWQEQSGSITATVPTKGQLELVYSTALAYGFDSILAFSYYQASEMTNPTALVNTDGSHHQNYAYVQKIISDLKGYDKILRKFTCDATTYNNTNDYMNSATTESYNNFINNSILNGISESSSKLIFTRLSNGNEKAVYICNMNDASASGNVTYTFDSSVKAVVVFTNGTRTFYDLTSSKSVTLNLGAGQGAFIIASV